MSIFSASRQFSSKDRIVVVMGPTGAGKSTFIDCATSQGGKNVGHSWKSETSQVRSVSVSHPTDRQPVVFVDTPGFDDTFKSDTEILSMIADWLVKTYKAKVNLATILYLHRISDNRMSGTAMKNLQLFSSLCGKKAMPNVVIVTTMWSLVPAEWGTKRENVLKREVWKDMLKAGCEVERFEDTLESAWKIIGSFAEDGLQDHVKLAREMVDDQLGLNETDAGITLFKTLEKLMKDQQNITRQMQERQKKYQGNELVVQELKGQAAGIQEKIQQTNAQLDTLKISRFRRFRLIFRLRQN
jgi:hypothetical protein